MTDDAYPACPRCGQKFIGRSWLCGCCPHCRLIPKGEQDFYDNHADGKCLVANADQGAPDNAGSQATS